MTNPDKFAQAVSRWLRPPKHRPKVTKVTIDGAVHIVETKDGVVMVCGDEMMTAIKEAK